MTEAKRNNVAVWFEIPATNFDRAAAFYEKLFGVSLKRESFGPNRLGVFPYDEPGVSGCIVQGPAYRPGNDGAVVYLNCDGRLDALIAKVEGIGGKLAGPKVDLPPGMGSFIHIVDCEGNRVGLHAA